MSAATTHHNPSAVAPGVGSPATAQVQAAIRDGHRMVPGVSLNLMDPTGVLQGLAGPVRTPVCAETVR